VRRWLVALGLVACNGEDKTLDRQALMDPESCKSCHIGHYEQWKGSMHAYAADDPVFLAMNRRGQEETGGALGDFCVRCHAPMAVREGATFDGLNLESLPQHLKGVTCYFCHSVEAVEGSHNAPLRLSNDSRLRGAITDPVDNPAHHSAYSPLLDRDHIASSDLCGSCHDLVTPAGVHLERTFAEWKDTLFGNGSSGALSCGNCHMTGSQGLAADFEGVKLRPIHDHRMPGVDVALTPWFDHDQHVEQVKAELSGVVLAQLCIAPPEGPTEIEVVLENAFAGHMFPSGAAQDRRAWVELVAYDASDAVVFSSGVVAAGEPVAELADPNLWLLRDQTFDARGDVAHMFWDVASYDSELLPQAKTTNPTEVHAKTRTYSFAPSAEVARATLRLIMRPMGLEVLGDLVASGHLDPAIVAEMPTFEVVHPIEWRLDLDGYGCKPKL
jgi:hypothetical protein